MRQLTYFLPLFFTKGCMCIQYLACAFTHTLYVHIYVHAHTCSNTHTCTHAHAHTHTHTHTHIHTHKHTNTNTHSQTHIHICIHVHVHTHTLPILAGMVSSLFSSTNNGSSSHKAPGPSYPPSMAPLNPSAPQFQQPGELHQS